MKVPTAPRARGRKGRSLEVRGRNLVPSLITLYASLNTLDVVVVL